MVKVKILVDGLEAADQHGGAHLLVPQRKEVWVEAYHRLFPKSTIQHEPLDWETKEPKRISDYVAGERVR